MRFLAALFFLATWLDARAENELHDFVVFSNSRIAGPYYFSKTTYSNGSFIENEKKKLIVTDKYFHTPGNALILNVINGSDGNWNADVFMFRTRGLDFFKPATHLSFFIYTTMDAVLPKVKLLLKDSVYTSAYEKKQLIKAFSWQRVLVPLSELSASAKPEDILGVAFSQNVFDGKDANYFIDDIELSTEENSSLHQAPAITQTKAGPRHVDIFWTPFENNDVHHVKIYRSENNDQFVPVGIQTTDRNIFTDYTGEGNKAYQYKISLVGYDYRETELSSPATATTKPFTDDELLTMVQESCFRYYWQGAEKTSGLALECIPGRQNLVGTGAAGFGIMALLVGMERKFISREEGVVRLEKITDYLKKAEKFKGAFPHFYHGPDYVVDTFFGGRDNGADLVETAFLIQGLIAAKNYLNTKNKAESAIISGIDKLWRGINWNWFKQTPESKYLYWHWSPDQAFVIDHPLIGFNETMIVYMLAISSPTYSVSPSMYYSGWASQDKMAQQYRGWGSSPDGRMYSNGNNYYGVKLPVAVGTGGQLFFTHYSYMGWDPQMITDKYTNYFENNKAFAMVNYRYSLQNPNNENGVGATGWGFTASDGPGSYFADSPKPDGEDGKITPTGAIASMPYLPKEAMASMKKFYYDYGHFLWGEYGFRDAFNLEQNWVSEIFMGLNQAPMVVMIENYRTGLIWKTFMKDKDVQIGLKKFNDFTTSLPKNNN